MPTSYNGWTASPDRNDFGGLNNSVIPGTSVKLAPGVRNGDVAVVLFYVADQLNKRVERAVPGTCWGYNYRANVNNPSTLSCHASGTAFDYNSDQHPNGVHGTFSPGQVAEIRKILAEVDNVVAWGGDFSGTIDSMHFEVHGNAAAVSAVADKLNGEDMPLSNEDVDRVAARVWSIGVRNAWGVVVSPVQILNGIETRLADVQTKAAKVLARFGIN